MLRKIKAQRLIAAKEYYHLERWSKQEFVDVYYEIKAFMKKGVA